MPDERSLLKMKGSGKGMKSIFQEEEWGGYISDIEQRMLQGYPVRIEHRDTNYLGGLISPSNCCHVPTPPSFLYVFYLKLKVQSCPKRSSTFSLSVFISLYLSLSLTLSFYFSLTHTRTHMHRDTTHTTHACTHTHTHLSLLTFSPDLHVFSIVAIGVIESTFAAQGKVHRQTSPSSPVNLLEIHNPRFSHPHTHKMNQNTTITE